MIVKKHSSKKNKTSKKIISRMNSLILERMLKNIYSTFDELGKKEMTNIFFSRNKKAKEKFVKKYLPNFKNIFNTEAEKLKKEIKKEIEKPK